MSTETAEPVDATSDAASVPFQKTVTDIVAGKEGSEYPKGDSVAWLESNSPQRKPATDPEVQTFLLKMGKALYASKMFSAGNDAQGIIIAEHCYALEISALEWIQRFHLIDGKPSMKAEAMLAAYQEAGGKVVWKNIGDDGSVAQATFTFLGQSKKIEIKYSIEDAKLAGLVKGGSNWVKNPGSMLRARLISKALRIVAPQVVSGIYTPEELGEEQSDGTGSSGEVSEPPKAKSEEPVPEVKVNTTSEAPAQQASDKESIPETVPGFCTDYQRTRIKELAKILKIPGQTLREIISKRGVTSLKQLTTKQAEELLGKLEAKATPQTQLNSWAEGALQKN